MEGLDDAILRCQIELKCLLIGVLNACARSRSCLRLRDTVDFGLSNLKVCSEFYCCLTGSVRMRADIMPSPNF